MGNCVFPTDGECVLLQHTQENMGGKMNSLADWTSAGHSHSDISGTRAWFSKIHFQSVKNQGPLVCNTSCMFSWFSNLQNQ